MEKLIEALKRNSVEVIISEDPHREAEKYSNVFVCEAASAAEDTGIIFFVGFEKRKNAALAAHHVAIVKKADIMPDTISAYLHAAKKGDIVFASSSASKTADIEGKLVWGMHGPKKLTVILEG
ncbi:hypothetical protein Asulf_00642 [Archaeoglobus sulfaticallidus PM70-1]|uniref:LUD domain-containing protein n=1 Tax=Archaeoglobus sulfaticallidus PM70-1 TaxID=387631 RepID=N0BKF5_9EURY|nr:LUD domain-containing protein [Archaeoglobus sulfaticallidus]AGK60660.1 hypothetical protein Asulf_00642 [Archaeoglobus sulfaticallidus PM70-1]